MKNLFINSTVSFITKYDKYDSKQIEKIKYGLEGIYLTIFKMIIIILLSILLNIVKEVILILFFFNIIRYFGFGIHARKSSECLITSIILFIGLPYIVFKTSFQYNILLIISIISLFSFIPFAPADTPKRPFKNKKKILIRKFITIFIGIVYLILSFIVNSLMLKKILLLAIIIQAIVVNPITYWILKQPYNNGKHGEKISK